MDMKEKDFDKFLSLPTKIADKIKEIEENVKTILKKDDMILAAKLEITRAKAKKRCPHKN